MSCGFWPQGSRGCACRPAVNINNNWGCQRPTWPSPCWPTPWPPVPPMPLTVTTGMATNITSTSATIAGNQFSPGCPGALQVGVEYCTNPNFTCQQSVMSPLTNPFTVQLIGLAPATTYYYRAFADTACGRIYGQILTFTTLSASMVVTGTAGPISSTTATIAGNTYANIPGTVTEVGVEYSLNPAFMPSQTATGTISPNFSVPLTGLTPGTTYYYRAYVMANGMRTLGNISSFTTTAT